MSDTSQGPGWWIASDGKWYPPELHPNYAPLAPPPPPAYPPDPMQPNFEQAPVSTHRPRTNGMAVASFVLAFFFWPLGIIFGHISRSKIRKTGERGAGLALAGLIISYVWGALTVVIVALAVFNAAVNSGYNNLDTLQGSVQQQIDNNLHTPSNADYSPGTDVSSVLCVRVAGTQFSCLVKLSNGQTSTLSITVSSDGSRWLSNN